jgi:hypothetical protein
MKIALCLSGQPRYIDVGYRNIYENILSKYDCDTFIHTWWDESKIGDKFDISEKMSYNRNCKWEENTIDKIEDLYNPKLIHFQTQKEFDIFGNVDYGFANPISIYSMYYSIMKSNELKKTYELENNFKYDIVIRCRFDITFEPLNLDLNNIDSNKIYVSGEIHYNSSTNTPNDQFAVSSSDNMDYYSSLYEKMSKYKDMGFKSFTGENLLKYHLVDLGKMNLYFTNNNELLCNIIKNL